VLAWFDDLQAGFTAGVNHISLRAHGKTVELAVRARTIVITGFDLENLTAGF
jgi:hypothetical protein